MPELDLGAAPILDFDGTMARLSVDWSGLRLTLGVDRIEQLWDDPVGTDGRGGRWRTVAAAECAAAMQARPVEEVVAELGRCAGFAVLTSNAAASVLLFCDSHPRLRERLRLVVGREQLGGPKTDFECFRDGFVACRQATAADRGDAPVLYAGDQLYELDFAGRLAAQVVAVETPEVVR